MEPGFHTYFHASFLSRCHPPSFTECGCCVDDPRPFLVLLSKQDVPVFPLPCCLDPRFVRSVGEQVFMMCSAHISSGGGGDQCWHEQTGLLYTCFIVHRLALCRPCPNTTYYAFDILFLTCHVSVEKRIPRVCVKGNMSMVFQRFSLNTAFTKTFLCISRLVLCTASLGVISLSCSTTSSRITSTIPSVHATHTERSFAPGEYQRYVDYTRAGPLYGRRSRNKPHATKSTCIYHSICLGQCDGGAPCRSSHLPA